MNQTEYRCCTQNLKLSLFVWLFLSEWNAFLVSTLLWKTKSSMVSTAWRTKQWLKHLLVLRAHLAPCMRDRERKNKKQQKRKNDTVKNRNNHIWIQRPPLYFVNKQHQKSKKPHCQSAHKEKAVDQRAWRSQITHFVWFCIWDPVVWQCWCHSHKIPIMVNYSASSFEYILYVLKYFMWN